MPLQATSGAASYDAFGGGGVAVVPNYIEDVFSTWLYTGNGSTQTITNGIDLAGEGGLVWFKTRSPDIGNYHALFDTVRGNASVISSNATDAANAYGTPNVLTSFNSTGFSLGSDNYGWVNTSGNSNVSWTFRKQPKFFDVVTWTGNSTANRQIAHNLGSAPGCIIVKCTNADINWPTYHRSITPSTNNILTLNSTNAASLSGVTRFGNDSAIVEPTSTVFTLGSAENVNASGNTYVAYLFAHDAGGFGLTGTDNVISCGSFTTDGGGSATVSLGYEPQWLTMKATTTTSSWWQVNNMSGFVASPSTATQYLALNSSGAESGWGSVMAPTATGFEATGLIGSTTYIYIAIRRGPMKVPTDPTTVFKPLTYTGNGSTQSITGVGFPPSAVLVADRNGGTDPVFIDKLRGIGLMLRTPQTFAEYNNANSLTSFNQNGVSYSYLNYVNGGSVPYVNYMFQRAPGYFDEVCYSPPSSSVNTYAHNLGAIPELMIIKTRDSARRWVVYTQPTGNTQALHLNTADAVNSTGNNYFNSTSPTASVFTLNNNFGDVCNGGGLGVAYLFASCPGVSKVGSYTGTGATQTIACGFTGGARFVLVKRTDSTGDWYVWDTARGMVSGTDPSLLLNSTAAEVNADSIYTATGGFQIVSTAAGINASGGTYIFLAIA